MWVWRAWTGGDFCHARQGSLGRILRVEAMIEAGAMDEHEPHECGAACKKDPVSG